MMSTAVPSGVHIVVRARGVANVICAGRTWAPVPTEFDASPQDVIDILRCPSLAVDWPPDYVAPDGTRPGRTTADVLAPADLSADRVGRAEEDAARSKRAVASADAEIALLKAHHANETSELRTKLRDALGATERDVALMRTQHAAETAALQSKMRDIEVRLVTVTGSVQGTERRLAEATAEVERLHQQHAAAMATIKREHAAELDTTRAKHLAEIDTLTAEHDRTVAALSAEMDRATAPGVTTAPVPNGAATKAPKGAKAGATGQAAGSNAG